MKRAFLLILLLFTALSAEESIQQLLDTKPAELKPRQDLYLIATGTIRVLEHHHFSRKQITPALSAEWFMEYFRLLDPMKTLFLQSDIDVFRPQETKLWDNEHNIVNLKFAFTVYRRYLQRLRERAAYYIANYDAPQDFSVKEYVDEDRKNADWPVSREEQLELWRKYVKNELLLLKIAKELPEPPSARKSVKPKKPQTEQEEIEAVKKRTARFYKHRAQMEPLEVLEIFLNALGHLYDPHTSYMAPSTMEDFEIDMQLSLQGIGATLSQTDDEYTTVVELVPNGPAAREGHLAKGDRIIAVAQGDEEPVDVIGMTLNKVVSLIRGKADTIVRLTVLKENETTPQIISIRRGVVELKEQEAKSSIKALRAEDGGTRRIMVLHLPSYYNHMTEHIKAQMKEARARGELDGVLLDLRTNGGGLLTEAIDICGLFLPWDSPIVQVSDSAVNTVLKTRIFASVYDGPLVVLVDGYSASASEITAAALQDSGRAIVVGDSMTHGKGTVQSTIDLKAIISQLRINGRALPGDKQYGMVKCTTSKFYRINGDSTQIKGVTPNVVIPSMLDKMESKEKFLPNALSGDTINPAMFERRSNLDALAPPLRAASEKRRAQLPEFQQGQKDIERYERLTAARKTAPLEHQERLALEREWQEASTALKTYYAANENLRELDGDDDKTAPRRDYIQDEALNILLDLIRLQAGSEPAKPARNRLQQFLDWFTN